MKAKSLIASIAATLALIAGLSTPVFAEFSPKFAHTYHFKDKGHTSQPVQRAAPHKKAPAEPRRADRRDDIYLNTP